MIWSRQGQVTYIECRGSVIPEAGEQWSSDGLLLSARGKGFASPLPDCLLHSPLLLLLYPSPMKYKHLPRRCNERFSEGLMPHVMLDDYTV